MKKLAALLLALVMVLSLAACGGNTDTPATPDTPSTPGTPGESDTPSAPAEPGQADVPQASGQAESITMQIQDPGTLGPFNGNSGGSGPIRHAIFQPLGARDGFAGEFKSVMIESYEKTGDLTYSVTIFDDIFDSAGNHITADDVVFSWQECQRIGELTETFDVESVTKTGDYTVEFKWKTTPSLGAFELQMSNVSIVSQAAYEASSSGMATDPVGTGPYVLDKFEAASSVTLKINEKYWETEDQMDLPMEKHNVNVMNFQVLSESSAITMALQSNSIDISAEVNFQDLVNFNDGGAYADQYDVRTTPKSSGLVLCMNASENSPLHDENLRQAITYAIDADFIAATVNGGNNSKLFVMGSPTYLDYDAGLEAMYHATDLEKAKDYMAKSEYADGVELKIIFISGNINQEDVAVVLQSQLAQIGVKLTIDGQQFGNYLANEGNPDGWDFTICTFGADDYLTNAWKKYFDANSTGTGATKNFVKDEHLQELIETAASEDGHSTESVLAVWQYISDNAWVHGLIVENDNVVYNSNLIADIAWDNYSNLAPGGFTYK